MTHSLDVITCFDQQKHHHQHQPPVGDIKFMTLTIKLHLKCVFSAVTNKICSLN